jgi:hypothetical protein
MPGDSYIATCALCGKHEAGPWENFEGWRHRILPSSSSLRDWQATELCPKCDRKLAFKIYCSYLILKTEAAA